MSGAEATMLAERVVDHAPIGPDGKKYGCLARAYHDYIGMEGDTGRGGEGKDKTLRTAEVAAHAAMLDGVIEEVEV